MTFLDLHQHPHKRFNPLTRSWVLVSPHRTQRPWLGKKEDGGFRVRPAYDPDCYLCPGNARAGGLRNPPYTDTFVFENDFAALRPDSETGVLDLEGLIVARGERGICRVVCFSPRHDLDLPLMTTRQIRNVVDVWAEQYDELGSIPWIKNVQIFENRGEMMGASNPHPHCQVWSNSSIPVENRRELQSFKSYSRSHGVCLLCRYIRLEAEAAERIVFENNHFVIVVPFWAVWPYETIVLSRSHRASLDQLSGEERDGLAEALHRIAIRYDNLFETPFPYSMGFHQKPTDGKPHPEWHLHAHFYPPLLRSASIKKFMVGYEMLANPQRDITPETAAERLRQLPDKLHRA